MELSDVSVSGGGSNDEMHIIVVDDGTINGTKDEVLEVFEGVSKAKTAKTQVEVIISIRSYLQKIVSNLLGRHNSNGTNWGDAKAGKTFTDVTPYRINFYRWCRWNSN